MASKKKATSTKGNMRDLPKSKKTLTSDQAKVVKGGTIGPKRDKLIVKI